MGPCNQTFLAGKYTVIFYVVGRIRAQVSTATKWNSNHKTTTTNYYHSIIIHISQEFKLGHILDHRCKSPQPNANQSRNGDAKIVSLKIDLKYM